jgi:ectoine hydroxylase-related dioxygenase (phytanoyl-CoA dioxygenase family)
MNLRFRCFAATASKRRDRGQLQYSGVETVMNTRLVSNLEYEQHEKNLDVYGYTVVKALLHEKTVENLKKVVNRLWDTVREEQYSGRQDRDIRDKLVYNLQNKDKCFIDLLIVPFVKRVCMTKLNDIYHRAIPANKPNYILNYYNARTSGDKLELHIDSHVPSSGRWCTAMQVSFLLDDMDESNGCTVVVPGSHRSDEFSDRAIEKDVPVLAQAGDVVIWDSRLWHGTRENTVNASRWALVATLTRWWLKQSMDMTRAVPDEIYRDLSDEQKSLLGFCSIPPRDERERINTKCGYEFLKTSVQDYYR